MNASNQDPLNRELHTLLRDSRPRPELPPRFRENVWRRIEQPGSRGQSSNWVETLAGLLLKPRFAIATVAVVLLTGTLAGSMNGQAQALHAAQERYVATVVMPSTP